MNLSKCCPSPLLSTAGHLGFGVWRLGILVRKCLRALSTARRSEAGGGSRQMSRGWDGGGTGDAERGYGGTVGMRSRGEIGGSNDSAGFGEREGVVL